MESDVSAEETNNNAADDSGRDSVKRKSDLDSDMDDLASLAALKKAAPEKEEPSSSTNHDPAPNISVGPPFQPPHLLPYLYPHGLYPGAQGLAGLPGLMLPGTSGAAGLGLSNHQLSLSHGTSPLSPPTSLPMAHNLLLAHNLLAAGAGHHLLGSRGYQGLAGLSGSLSNNNNNCSVSTNGTNGPPHLGVTPPTSSSPAAPSPLLPDRLKPPRFTPYLPSSSAASLSSLSSVLSSSLSSMSSPLLSSSLSSSLSTSLLGEAQLGGSSAFQAVSPKTSTRLDDSSIRRSASSVHAASVASELKSIEKMVNGLDRRPPEIPDPLKLSDK